MNHKYLKYIFYINVYIFIFKYLTKKKNNCRQITTNKTEKMKESQRRTRKETDKG